MRSRARRVAAPEVAHVELADGGAGLRPVRDAVDHEAAGAADPLAAVVVEGDRLLAALAELLVQDVEHLEERAVLVDPLDAVLDHPPRLARARLPPDVQGQVHHL
jgi:hypothetical protein